MNESPSAWQVCTFSTKTASTVSPVASQVPAKPDAPAVRCYTYFTFELFPSGPINVKLSLSVFPSLDSSQIAVIRIRPLFLRTTFHESGRSLVTDSVVPPVPGWSVPSTTMVSGLPPPKSKAYLLPPALSTFITSLSLLLDGLSFHSPTNGSFAAHNAAAIRQATSTNRKLCFNMSPSLFELPCSYYKTWNQRGCFIWKRRSAQQRF